MTDTMSAPNRPRTGFRGSLAALRRLAAVAGVLLLLPALAAAQQDAGPSGSAAGQQESAESGPIQPHPEAVKAIGRLKSPFCPGLMLEVCPSPQAAELRDTLQQMARSGVKADSLVAWMLARHGEEWSAVPETRGSDLVAWIMPPLVLLLGGALVVVVLRRMRSSGGSDERAGDDPGLSEEEERRLSEAMRQLEREGR